jgi:hypothetical protein
VGQYASGGAEALATTCLPSTVWAIFMIVLVFPLPLLANAKTQLSFSGPLFSLNDSASKIHGLLVAF